jgi:Rrf2 family nitric oxide-sensitive transcriptional repressor
MRLTKKTDYCIRVLIYLQKHPGRAKIQDIADSYNISKNHLSVAVNKLSELNYIKTTQGPMGGIEFNKATANNTVGKVISDIEDFEIAECFNQKTNSCNISSNCKLQRMLTKSTKAFINELNNYKIKDLA